jgi:hypothetical protein
VHDPSLTAAAAAEKRGRRRGRKGTLAPPAAGRVGVHVRNRRDLGRDIMTVRSNISGLISPRKRRGAGIFTLEPC